VTPTRTGSALWLALALALPAHAAAEVDFQASTDATEIAADETLTLRIAATYESKGDTGDLQLPAFADFDVVGQPARSEQMSFTFSNGSPSFRRNVVTSITLTPKRAGDLTIEPAKLQARGKTWQTQPIHVHVVAAGQASRGGRANPDPRAGRPFPDVDPFGDVHPGQRDLLLRATVDSERPFVGQQITYSLYLLARANVSGIEKQQLPRLDGFWSEDIEAPQQLVPEQRILDGVPYTAYLLRRRALFPLRAGRATIEPAEVQVLTGFGMLFSRGSSRVVSQALHVDVQPLPAGKPAGFDSGNVGEWSLTAGAEPLGVAAGQPITFRLVASGHGNVRDLRLPKLESIEGVRSYDPTVTEKASIEHGQVQGTRTVEQLLVPEKAGAVEIPALTMEIFDPEQRQYRTLRTSPVTVQVVPAQAGQTASAVAQNLLAGGDVRPIRLRLRTLQRAAPPWAQPWFWPALAAPPFALALMLALGGVRRAFRVDPGDRRIRRARSAAEKRLRGARALLQRGEPVAFYAEISRAVSGFLADNQDISASGLTREELAAALLALGHAEETVRRLARILDDCDRARFAPGSSEAPAREAMLERAEQVLNALDRRSP
jgi:hypothetical protein